MNMNINFEFYYIFPLFWIGLIQGQHLCDLDETSCSDKWVENVFKTLLKGVVSSINHLRMDEFSYQIPGFEYHMTNITLSPMKNCFAEAHVDEGENLYNYTIHCSQLVLEAQVTARGRFGYLFIDASDTVTITADKYILSANGQYGVTLDKKDKSPRFYGTPCYTVDNEVLGDIRFELYNNFGIWNIEGSKLCDLNNEDCITRAAQYIFKSILSGASNVIGPINPMVLNNIGYQIPGFKYRLTNATFSGLESCVPKEKLNTYESTYDYVLYCSQLILSANVEAYGNLGPVYVDGNDFVTITADQYIISVKGYYGTFISEEDYSERFYLKNVIATDTDPQGKITFNSCNSFGLPKLQVLLADTYFKSKWKSLEKAFQYPIITEFVSKLLYAIDVFVKATPISKILTQ